MFVTLAVRRACGSHQIADSQIAVGVDEQIVRLQVPVHNIRAVQVLEPSQNLICEVFEMFVGKLLRRANDVIQ
eukprot:3357815-Rhodomonas_salina.1